MLATAFSQKTEHSYVDRVEGKNWACSNKHLSLPIDLDSMCCREDEKLVVA